MVGISCQNPLPWNVQPASSTAYMSAPNTWYLRQVARYLLYSAWSCRRVFVRSATVYLYGACRGSSRRQRRGRDGEPREGHLTAAPAQLPWRSHGEAVAALATARRFKSTG